MLLRFSFATISEKLLGITKEILKILKKLMLKERVGVPENMFKAAKLKIRIFSPIYFKGVRNVYAGLCKIFENGLME